MPPKASCTAPAQDGYVGVVALDLAKTTEMAAEEVCRIASKLTDTADEIRQCQTNQERRTCVAKAMRDYETAVQWVQVIVPPEEDDPEDHNSATADEEKLAQGSGPAAPANTVTSGPPPPRVPFVEIGGKAVPPPPSHPPSLPIGRNLPRGQFDSHFRRDNASPAWSNCSSTASLHTPHELPQQRRAEAHPASRCNPNFNLDGAGSWSNRSSSTCADSVQEFQQHKYYDRQQPQQQQLLPNQGAAQMQLNANLMRQQQGQQQQLQNLQNLLHPQQPIMNELQQRLAGMLLPVPNNQHCMSQPMACMQNSPAIQSTQPMPQQMAGMQNPQAQAMAGLQNSQPMMGMQSTQPIGGIQSTQPMAGMQNAQGMAGMQNTQAMAGMQSTQPMQAMQNAPAMQGPNCGHSMAAMQQGNFQVQVIAVPMGAPPPQGTILAATAEPPSGALGPNGSAVNEQFPQDLCKPANSKKFHIINPSTGEEVQGPVESDKTSKRLQIRNPATGKEVLPGDVPTEDKENMESGALLEEHHHSSETSLPEAKSKSVSEDKSGTDVPVSGKSASGSWDWPLSRNEIRDRLVQLPH